jgi:hypothetical protein
MHLGVSEDRMPSQAEARAHDAGKDGLADQELLRALSGLVVVVNEPIIRRLEAVEFLCFAADRELWRNRTSLRLSAAGASSSPA